MTDFVARTGRTTVTLVLRVVADAGRSGGFAGHAEIVDTGQVVPIREVQDLTDLIGTLLE